MRQAAELLDREGFRPHTQPGRAMLPTEYQFHRERYYSKKELDALPFLQLVGVKHFDYGGEHETDAHMLIGKRKGLAWDKGIGMGAFAINRLAAPDAVVRKLRDSELSRLLLRPTHLTRWVRKDGQPTLRYLSWGGDNPPPWWEVTSDLELPALAPSVKLIDTRTGEPADERSGSCFLHEDSFAFPQLRYRREDLERMPPFDIACTQERFDRGYIWVRPPSARARVVSQRFRQFCLKAGIKASFVPVQIEE